MKNYYNVMKKVLIAGVIANAGMSVVVFTLIQLGVLDLTK